MTSSAALRRRIAQLARYATTSLVATSTSLRGYEHYATLPEVTVADDVATFRATVMQRLLDERPLARANAPVNSDPLREHLLWTHCLKAPLVDIAALLH